MTLGVDVGGTFTDLAWWDGSRLHAAKTSTTADQSVGVESGARLLVGDARVPLLVHGTTVATNALLERDGADTVLIVDAGFEDLIEIGRQARPSLYDPLADRPAPLLDRRSRLGWDPARVGDLTDEIRRRGPEAVAVSLLYGFRDTDREAQVVEWVRSALGEVPVAPSHLVVPEFREYERTSTTVVNAYLRPKVEAYLRHLSRRVVPDPAERLLVMRSSGGLMTPDDAAELAAAILLSGPAGGVVAAAALGQALGYHRIVSFDMGGTSTDVCRVEHGRPEIVYERTVEGQVVRLPSVAIHTVGAGGGSIGWADPGNALRVGPRSAGADPGPACYGRGGVDPTVTDANLALGRITESLAGSLQVRPDAAVAALARLGGRLGLDPVETALGMVEVVEAHMERAIRAVSVEEGADPRSAVLVAFGGAGGLHASALARRLEMAGVVVPPYAGVFSALGLLLSPPRQDAARSVLLTPAQADLLDRGVSDVAAEVVGRLTERSGSPPVRVETSVDVRYLGQSHETTVPYRAGEGWEVLAERFHRAHAARNGFSRPDDPIEAVTVRAAAVGQAALSWERLPEHRPEGDARLPERTVVTSEGPTTAQVWWRPGMRPGDEVVGPCVVTEGEATIYLAPGERGLLHPSGALEVTW